MGGLLGWLAGCGMLTLIGILLLLFLRDIHALPAKAVRDIAVIGLMTMAAGLMYLLSCALLRQAVFQDVENPGDLTQFIPGAYWRETAELLKNPSWKGVLTGLFVYGGHFLGKALFQQYLAGGCCLSFLLTILSAGLIYARLLRCIGEQGAKDCVFLLLTLPSSVFCFLPGWPPLAALLLACLFFFLGKLIPGRQAAIPRAAYIVSVSFNAVLSAFAVAALALGRIG